MSNLSKALTLDKNVMVRACAGAGKTFALTKRYVAILDQFARIHQNQPDSKPLGPENILVITFTKKATAEMFSRIYDDVHKILHGNSSEVEGHSAIPDFGRNLKSAPQKFRDELLSSFNQAQIMTIDAFCLKALKEHPLKANIDPAVQIGEESQITEIENRVLTDYLGERAKNYDPHLKQLIDNIGYYQTQQFLLFLKNHPTKTDLLKNYYFNTDDETIFKDWKTQYQPEINYENLLSEFEKIVNEIAAIGLPEKIESTWQDHFEQLNQWQQTPADNKLEFFIIQILPIFLTSNNKYRKSIKLGNQKDWKKSGLNIEYKKDLESRLTDLIQKFECQIPINLTRYIFHQSDQSAIPLMRILLELEDEYSARLSLAKQKERLLSFNDILLKAREMFANNESIAGQYGRQYQHIMIDEFQDTNDLRWEIIKTIAQKNGELRRAGIFIVGDEKQSIYRFNQADVKVMAQAGHDLENAASNLKLVEFDDNYRSSPDLIKMCINPLFKKILSFAAEKQEDYEAVYQETVYPESTKPESKRSEDVEIGGIFDINILKIGKSEDKNDHQFDSDPLAYPKHVAQIIQDLKRTSQWEKIPKNKYPLLGVLLRNVKSNLHLYREAFKLAKLDFEIVGSGGFYERQEILDVEQVLSFLVNPHDDAALVGILRSPLFAFEDTQLHSLLSVNRKNKSIFDYLAHQNPDIHYELNSWLEKARITPIDRVLSDIFEAHHRDLGYFSETDGLQRWANLEKCFDLIHTWSIKGAGVIEIRNILRQKIESNEDCSFAPLPGQAEIAITSIHKAKGLEFPFVIIPDMQREFNYGKSESLQIENLTGKDGTVRTELGIIMNKIDGSSSKATILNLLKDQNQNELFAELRRLFYVAVTRAKYGVILSGYIKEKKSGYSETPDFTIEKSKTWLDWIRNIYDINAEKIESGVTIDIENGPKITFTDHEFSFIKRDDQFQTMPLNLSNSKTTLPLYRRIGVHDISTKFEIIGNQTEPKSEGLSGTIFGSLIHKILEMDWLDWERHKTKILQWNNAQEEQLDLIDNESKLKKYVENLCQHPEIKLIQNLPDNQKFAEIPINCFLKNTDADKIYELSGVIDLLYQKDSKWIVVDYKTDLTKTRQLQYEAQIQIYLQIIKHLYNFNCEGVIIYAATGELEKVNFQKDFFTNLKFHGATGWKLTIPEGFNSGLENEYSKLPHNSIVICPTPRRVQDLKMKLVLAQNFNPHHKIMTIDEFDEKIDTKGWQKVTKITKRFIIRKLFQNQYQGKKFTDYPGLLTMLVGAFDLASQKNITLKNGLQEKYQNYRQILKQRQLTENFYDLIIDQFDWDNINLYIDGCISVDESEIEFLEKICRKAKKTNYLPLQGAVQESINYNLQDLTLGGFTVAKERYLFVRPFDANEEIEYLASQIQNDMQSGIDYDEMLVVLPSMEKYLTRVMTIFKRVDIPITSSKRQPLLKQPLVHTINSLLEIIGNISSVKRQTNDHKELKWLTIYSWFSNSISEYCNGNQLHLTEYRNGLNALDLIFRRNAISAWNDVDDENIDHFTYTAKLGGHSKSLAIKSFHLIEKFLTEISSFLDEMSEPKVLEKILVEWISNSGAMAMIDRKVLTLYYQSVCNLNEAVIANDIELSFLTYRQELNEILSNLEVFDQDQNWGVPVVSIMDSVKIRKKRIYAIGLSQSDFPAMAPRNFLIPNYVDYHDRTNFMIFQSWFDNSTEKLFLSCPINGIDGREQQTSIFLEGLTITQSQFLALDADHYRKKDTFGKIITHKTDQVDLPENDKVEDQQLNRQIMRHNALLENPVHPAYFGKISESHLPIGDNIFSATQLDELAKTPLFFMIKRLWQVRETDVEKSVMLERGQLIHAALEEFSELKPQSGWALVRVDPISAKKKLLAVVDRLLQIKELNADVDLEDYANYKQFTSGLDGQGFAGILSRIIDEENEIIPDIKSHTAEQLFGAGTSDSWQMYSLKHEKLGDIKFRGAIDRFDIQPEKNIILAMDYKTGKIDWTALEKKYSTQLPLYYLVLNEHFPDFNILLTYRQLKSLKDSLYGFYRYWLGDIHPQEVLDQFKKTRADRSIILSDIKNEMETNLKACFTPYISGTFAPFKKGIQRSKSNYYYLKSAARIETIRYFISDIAE